MQLVKTPNLSENKKPLGGGAFILFMIIITIF